MAVLKRLYFDIETSPNIGYFWKTGYRERIGPEAIVEERKVICICWKIEGQDKVHSVTWDKKQNDYKAIKKFIEVANKADVLIGHNGDRFDIPWIRTRALYHRLEWPPKPVTTDTLKRARGNFRFNSNKLDYIAKYLGVGGKLETGGFDLWKNVISGNEEALQRMVDYCKRDVVILEKVHQALINYVPVTSHAGAFTGGKIWTCPRCASTSVFQFNKRSTATGIIKYQMKCKKCYGYYTISGKAHSDYIKSKRNGKK